LFEFELPDVGEGIHEGEIVNWLVGEGDVVDEDQDIVEVMTDKATVQISSPVAGTIDEIVFDEGDVVNVGEVFVVIDAEGETTDATVEESDEPDPADQPEPAGSPDEPEPTPSASSSRTNGHQPQRTPKGILAPPSVRIEARKRGIDITKVDGTGPAGRISLDDLDTHGPSDEPTPEPATTQPSGGSVAGVLPYDLDPPSVDRENALAVERVQAPTTSPRASASRANRLQPHFSHAIEVDADELVDRAHRALANADEDALDVQTAFVVKALARGLAENERCNAWVDEEDRALVIADDVNPAVAVPTDDGLELRTVENADQRGVLDIARTLAEGGDDAEPTFTVTAYGENNGGLVHTPMLVHPQVACVALGEVREVGKLDGGQPRPGHDVTLAFTFDHRYVDGYDGAMFAEDVRELLANPGTMLLG
jgi:pyruvate dehydrogenase E2 component (dihydrolipoamide acetyltransferase)